MLDINQLTMKVVFQEVLELPGAQLILTTYTEKKQNKHDRLISENNGQADGRVERERLKIWKRQEE